MKNMVIWVCNQDDFRLVILTGHGRRPKVSLRVGQVWCDMTESIYAPQERQVISGRQFQHSRTGSKRTATEASGRNRHEGGGQG